MIHSCRLWKRSYSNDLVVIAILRLSFFIASIFLGMHFLDRIRKWFTDVDFGYTAKVGNLSKQEGR